MGEKRKMDKLFNECDVRDRRYNIRNTIREESVLSFVLHNANIAVYGVLIMDNIVVFPLGFY